MTSPFQAGYAQRWARGFGLLTRLEQPIQTLLGICAFHGVLPLEFKPAYSVERLARPAPGCARTGGGGEGWCTTGARGPLCQCLQSQLTAGSLTVWGQLPQERQGCIAHWAERGMGNTSREQRNPNNGCRCCCESSWPKGCYPWSSSRHIQWATCSRSILTSWSKGPRAKVASCKFSSTTSRRYTKSIRRLLLNVAHEYSR